MPWIPTSCPLRTRFRPNTPAQNQWCFWSKPFLPFFFFFLRTQGRNAKYALMLPTTTVRAQRTGSGSSWGYTARWPLPNNTAFLGCISFGKIHVESADYSNQTRSISPLNIDFPEQQQIVWAGRVRLRQYFFVSLHHCWNIASLSVELAWCFSGSTCLSCAPRCCTASLQNESVVPPPPPQ